MATKNGPIKISPSGISYLMECPRCLWLQVNENVRRPRGIFPSLPGGMDLVIKSYFDKYRGSLPPELERQIDGVLMDDVSLLNRWRNWRIGLEYQDKERDAVLCGALDDCVTRDQKVGPKNQTFYMPLDYKTRGFPPQEGASEIYYQHQLDAYTLLLSENGKRVGDYAYLVYYYPKEVKERGEVQFEVKPVKIQTDTERIRKMFRDAVDLLRGELPKEHGIYANGSATCEFGLWHNLAMEFD
jgi:CRISPR/Cas system-associated exonuclease Cas4 (RecB family)